MDPDELDALRGALGVLHFPTRFGQLARALPTPAAGMGFLPEPILLVQLGEHPRPPPSSIASSDLRKHASFTLLRLYGASR